MYPFSERQWHWNRCNFTHKLKKLVIHHKVDIIGMAECNVDWRTRKDLFADRITGWFSHKKVICTNNRKVSQMLSKPFQSGGTATIATNTTARQATSSGVDHRGLGRWSWMRFTGKHGLTTRVITAYCPIKNLNPSGCYSQQIQGLLAQGIKSCPWRQFWIDLKALVEEAHTNGEQHSYGRLEQQDEGCGRIF